jgi:hypothetical protein
VANGPYIEEVEETWLAGTRLDEFLYQNDPAKGLGYAFQRDALALSLRSSSRWNYSRLELEYNQLDENDKLTSEIVEVRHASHSDHVQEHNGWIKQHVQELKHVEVPITDGADLWSRCEELFPSLQFCDSVGGALRSFHPGNSPFNSITRKLFDLEEYCKNWREQGGQFDPRNIPGKRHPESEATLNMYEQERTFLCPDGEKRVFTLHIWITEYWRLYYWPLLEQKKMIIGYIGGHLSTPKYRT